MAWLARILARSSDEPVCDQHQRERHQRHNAARGREDYAEALHQDGARVFSVGDEGPPEALQIAPQEEEIMKSQFLGPIYT